MSECIFANEELRKEENAVCFLRFWRYLNGESEEGEATFDLKEAFDLTTQDGANVCWQRFNELSNKSLKLFNEEALKSFVDFANSNLGRCEHLSEEQKENIVNNFLYIHRFLIFDIRQYLNSGWLAELGYRNFIFNKNSHFSLNIQEAFDLTSEAGAEACFLFFGNPIINQRKVEEVDFNVIKDFMYFAEHKILPCLNLYFNQKEFIFEYFFLPYKESYQIIYTNYFKGKDLPFFPCCLFVEYLRGCHVIRLLSLNEVFDTSSTEGRFFFTIMCRRLTHRFQSQRLLGQFAMQDVDELIDVIERNILPREDISSAVKKDIIDGLFSAFDEYELYVNYFQSARRQFFPKSLLPCLYLERLLGPSEFIFQPSMLKKVNDVRNVFNFNNKSGYQKLNWHLEHGAVKLAKAYGQRPGKELMFANFIKFATTDLIETDLIEPPRS
jgi:hypothetical protein